MPDVNADSPRQSRHGRRALAVLIALVAGALGWVWLLAEVQRQDKWMRTAVVLLAGGAGFLVWVLFGSGWRPRARWTVFAGTIVVIVFAGTCLRIRGVSGDLVPILEWRWHTAGLPLATNIVAPKAPPWLPLTNHYPQFLGPERNGVLPGPELARDWAADPPAELWRHPVGAAWSGFAIEGTRAITQEQRGGEEVVVCYELLSGREIWTHSARARYATTIAGEGPRATPTIADGRVFTLGGSGILNCLDLATGEVIWRTNTLQEFGAKLPEWGVACSPLVTESAVLVTVGGAGHTLVAYDRRTGRRLWAAGVDDAQWSSPVRVTLAGVPQILTFNDSLAAHDERTGAVLWRSPWPGVYPRVSVPLALPGDRVLVSTGYGVGAELLQIARENDRWRVQRVWKSLRLKSKFGSFFVIDGFLYGLDDGALACVDMNDGTLKWKGDRYGHGQMLRVGGLLLLMAESGAIVLIEPSPAGQRELTRHKVFTAKTWNPPALAGDLLVVRNDQEAACLRLPLVGKSLRP